MAMRSMSTTTTTTTTQAKSTSPPPWARVHASQWSLDSPKTEESCRALVPCVFVKQKRTYSLCIYLKKEVVLDPAKNFRSFFAFVFVMSSRPPPYFLVAVFFFFFDALFFSMLRVAARRAGNKAVFSFFSSSRVASASSASQKRTVVIMAGEKRREQRDAKALAFVCRSKQSRIDNASFFFDLHRFFFSLDLFSPLFFPFFFLLHLSPFVEGRRRFS